MASYFEGVIEVLFHPKQLFEEMPLTGGYKEPLLFASINIILATLLNSLKEIILGNAALDIMPLAINFITNVVGGIVGLFIAYGIIHLLLKIVGAKKDFEATFRVGACLTAFALLSWIPYLGIIILLYVAYLEIVVFAKIHEISAFRSFIAVLLIPLIVLLIIAIMTAGLSYLWISGLQRDMLSQTQNGISTTSNTENMGGVDDRIISQKDIHISIDSVFRTKTDNNLNIVIRNIGITSFSDNDLSVYVSETLIGSSKCALTKPSEICTIALGANSFPSKGSGANIKIVATNGAKTEYLCRGTDNDFC